MLNTAIFLNKHHLLTQDKIKYVKINIKMSFFNLLGFYAPLPSFNSQNSRVFTLRLQEIMKLNPHKKKGMVL